MTKAVRLTFVFIGLLTWAIMSAFFKSLFEILNPNLNIFLIGKEFALNNFLGLLSGIICSLILWKNEKVNSLGIEIVSELKKVTWPQKAETKISTIVVIVITIIISIILGVFDYIWASITGLIYDF